MSLETFEKLPEEKRERILSEGIRAFAGSSYRDVSTDDITNACQISKGILFHYFGSKKEYYLYCLEKSMERLTQPQEEGEETDFYGILFGTMDRKISLCAKYRDEMLMVNMASRDAAGEVATAKAEILGRYRETVRAESVRTLEKALAHLPLAEEKRTPLAAQGLHIYISAVLDRYLLQYRENPEEFFRNSEKIRNEMKEYIDLMLYGICEGS